MCVENPVDAARAFVDAGSDVIHVVDLDGAFEGAMRNLKTIQAIAELGMFVELGGGMRDESSVRAAFDAGVSRAIIGTKACTNPEFAEASMWYTSCLMYECKPGGELRVQKLNLLDTVHSIPFYNRLSVFFRFRQAI